MAKVRKQDSQRPIEIIAKTPTEMQIEDLTFYIQQKKWMNLSDPGTQKTGSVCLWFQYLWEQHNSKSIWSMPKGLLFKNKIELLEFTNFSWNEVIIVDGTPAERAAQMATPEGKVFLMGYTRFALDWRNLKEIHPEVNAHVVDEFHMGFKTAKSKRAQELFRAHRRLDYFGIMTGTLIDGRLDHAYPAIKVIEPRYYADHDDFLNRHAEMDLDDNVIGWHDYERLGRILNNHSIRRTFEEVHGKVEKKIQVQLCEMHPRQQDAYDEFEEDALLELDSFIDTLNSDVLEAEQPGVKTIRCRQILAHPETFDILKKGQMTGKDEALEIHCTDHLRKKEPLIIFATLKPEQRRIAALASDLGLRVGLINSDVSPKKRGEIDLAFRNGELDVVVASPATTSVGYNWGHVDHVIFASVDYSDSNFSQGFKRAIRGARETPLRITVLTYGTRVCHRMIEVLEYKSMLKHKVDPSYEILEISG